MTEVPDKQTEGTGVGRGRAAAVGAAEADRRASRSPPAAGSARGRRRERIHDGPGTSAALPGERLSSVPVGSLTEADLAAAEVFTLDDLDPSATCGRRRRGRRARWRRTRDDERPRRRRAAWWTRPRSRPRPRRSREPHRPRPATTGGAELVDEDEEEEDEAPIQAPADRGRTPFGSVWDSQLGTTAAAGDLPPPSHEDEDFDEPEIPEYLIAEQRRGPAAARRRRGRGPRGGRSAYQSAMDARTVRRWRRTGGINRYPDVSGRTTPMATAEERWPQLRSTRTIDRASRPARQLGRAVERGPAGARGHASRSGRPEDVAAVGRRSVVERQDDRCGRGRGRRPRGRRQRHHLAADRRLDVRTQAANDAEGADHRER